MSGRSFARAGPGHLGMALVATLWGGVTGPGCGGDGDGEGTDPDPIDNVDPDEVSALRLRPSEVSIDGATVLPLKAHVVADDGGRYDLAPWDLVYSVDDPDVAAVDGAGRVVPLREGTVVVTATWGEVRSEPCVVRVVAPGHLQVRVVDFETGLPLPAAAVWVGDETLTGPVFADGDGVAVVEGGFYGPATVTADFEGYRRTTLQGAAAREIRLALARDGQPPPESTFYGEVGLPADPGPGQLGIALSVASIPESPILANLTDFIGDLHEVQAFGLATAIPENLVVTGVQDHFVAPADPGPRRVVTLGGILDVGLLLDLVIRVNEYGPGAIFEVLGQHTDVLLLGATALFDLEPGATQGGVQVQALYPLTREAHVTLAPPPEGNFPDPATLVALREGTDGGGYLVAGLGIGLNVYPDPGDDDTTGDDDDSTWNEVLPAAAGAAAGGEVGWESIDVHEAETADSGPFAVARTRYLASVFEDGLGSGSRSSILLSTPTEDPDLTLPEFLGLTEMYAPDDRDVAQSILTWSGDESATVRVVTLEADGRWWDLWCPGDRNSVGVPQGLAEFVPDEVYWRYQVHNAYGVLGASFDSLANDADEGFADLSGLLQRRTDAVIFWEAPSWP